MLPLRKSQSFSKNAGFQFLKFFKKSKGEIVEKPRTQSFNRHSTIDNSELERPRASSTSIKRKISNMVKTDLPKNLKKTSSIRDFAKKGKSEGNKSDIWSSLHSLAENDMAVSSSDFSFVNYDVLNTCSYVHKEDTLGVQLMRSQSVSVQNVSLV